MARIFCQNGPMSTTRSLRTGMLPMAEMTGTWPASTIGFMRSLHASTARPSIRIPQEPQIIIRQLFRYESEPSRRSLTMSRQSRRHAHSGASNSYSFTARSPDSGSYRQILRRYVHMSVLSSATKQDLRGRGSADLALQLSDVCHLVGGRGVEGHVRHRSRTAPWTRSRHRAGRWRGTRTRSCARGRRRRSRRRRAGASFPRR